MQRVRKDRTVVVYNYYNYGELLPSSSSVKSMTSSSRDSEWRKEVIITEQMSPPTIVTNREGLRGRPTHRDLPKIIQIISHEVLNAMGLRTLLHM